MLHFRAKIKENSLVFACSQPSHKEVRIENVYQDNELRIMTPSTGEVEIDPIKNIITKLIIDPSGDPCRRMEVHFNTATFVQTYLTANEFTVKKAMEVFNLSENLQGIFKSHIDYYRNNVTLNILYLKNRLESSFSSFFEHYNNELYPDRTLDWLFSKADIKEIKQQIILCLDRQIENFQLARELELLGRVHYVCEVKDNLDSSYDPYSTYCDCATIREAIQHFESDSRIQEFLQDRDRYTVSFRPNSYHL